MDASRFSLNEATELLKPHFDNLPFLRLRDYLKAEVTLGSEYQCRVVIPPEHLTIPAVISLDTKVFRVSSRYWKMASTRILGQQLFFTPEEELTPPWLFGKSAFSPYVGMEVFQADESTVVHVRHELDLPSECSDDGFAAECWDTIGKWIGQSIERRAKTNASLAAVREECAKRAKAIRAFEAHY